jgi:hypothetical protein
MHFPGFGKLSTAKKYKCDFFGAGGSIVYETNTYQNKNEKNEKMLDSRMKLNLRI